MNYLPTSRLGAKRHKKSRAASSVHMLCRVARFVVLGDWVWGSLSGVEFHV